MSCSSCPGRWCTATRDPAARRAGRRPSLPVVGEEEGGPGRIAVARAPASTRRRSRSAVFPFRRRGDGRYVRARRRMSSRGRPPRSSPVPSPRRDLRLRGPLPRPHGVPRPPVRRRRRGHDAGGDRLRVASRRSTSGCAVRWNFSPRLIEKTVRITDAFFRKHMGIPPRGSRGRRQPPRGRGGMFGDDEATLVARRWPPAGRGDRRHGAVPADTYSSARTTAPSTWSWR